MTTATTVMKQHLIDPEICIRCNTCEETCPIDAITHDSNNYVVDASICNDCMACVPPCPTGAIDNWIQVVSDKAYSIEEQFTWDELPEPQEVPEGAQIVEAKAADSAGAFAAQKEEGDQDLENKPFTAAGASIPPWSAAHPYTNLYTHKNPVTAMVVGNYRVTDSDTDSDIHHIVLDMGDTPMPLLEGQSIAIFPAGEDENGRPYHARQYSIASPRDGERPGYNNLSITVKRVVEDHDGNPVKGVCSNYLCDLQKNDTVKLIGPYGNSFLMPNLPDSNLVMICTGTGAAPMRAMTEHCRRLNKAGKYHGKLMLFFGARSERELPYFGPLMNLPKDFIDINLALSRQADRPKKYVQDLIRERASDVLALINDSKTCIYVCGLKGMEEGVLAALQDIITQSGKKWEDVHTQLKNQGRLHFETY
jgi:benzoyl-CoA 2,3-dioxygenase component A